MHRMSYENYDPYFPDQPTVDQYLPLWANLPAFASKPAFVWADDDGSNAETLTYSQLNKHVQSISSHLLLCPLNRGDTVVILCSPGLELVKTIFGCQRAGLVCVPISPPDPSSTSNTHHHLVRALSQTNPKAAIASSDYIKHIRQNASEKSTTHLSELLDKLIWISTDEPKSPSVLSSYNGCKLDEAYLVQYTSGATGIPKPVLVTAGSAAHNVRTARKSYDLHPNSVIVSWLPQYHDCGLMFLLLTIVSGATCVLASSMAFVKRPRLWLELISDYKGTCTPVPSFTLPLVVKRGGVSKGTKPINLWSMKNLIIINEPIYKESVQEFIKVFSSFGLDPSSISPSYGLAENCTFVSTSWRSFCHYDAVPSHNKLLPSARLGSNDEDEDDEIDMIVVNEETHKPVEDGVEGEIWVSSPSNASGYLGHPSLTREVFMARLSDQVSRCFIRTGDRGVVKGEERYLFVTGRCSDVLLHHNREVHPHYIETAAYKSCTEFIRGGCLGAFDASGTITVVAEMQKSLGEMKILKRVCEGIRESVMKEEKVDVGLVVLVKSGSVPKTTSGKIKRWEVKNMLADGAMSVIFQMQIDERRDHHIANESRKERMVDHDQMTKGTDFSANKAPSHSPIQSSL